MYTSHFSYVLARRVVQKLNLNEYVPYESNPSYRTSFKVEYLINCDYLVGNGTLGLKDEHLKTVIKKLCLTGSAQIVLESSVCDGTSCMWDCRGSDIISVLNMNEPSYLSLIYFYMNPYLFFTRRNLLGVSQHIGHNLLFRLRPATWILKALSPGFQR